MKIKKGAEIKINTKRIINIDTMITKIAQNAFNDPSIRKYIVKKIKRLAKKQEI